MSFAPTLAATAASAAEIILFEGDELSGQGVAFRGIVPNLGDTGFNDRAASVSVRDGVWEVCYDAEFQGACMQLPPGDYRRLEPPFYRSISSLRPIAGTDTNSNPAILENWYFTIWGYNGFTGPGANISNHPLDPVFTTREAWR